MPGATPRGCVGQPGHNGGHDVPRAVLEDCERADALEVPLQPKQSYHTIIYHKSIFKNDDYVYPLELKNKYKWL